MKGLSQITAAVLLLGVAVSIVSVYAQWAPNFAEETASSVANQSNKDIKCSNAAISIEGPVYDRSGDNINFTLENDGTIRFSEKITVGLFNSSLLLGRETVSQLEVGEEQELFMPSNETPDNIVFSTRECPDLSVTEDQIRVQK